jgi:hypothetical protein
VVGGLWAVDKGIGMIIIVSWVLVELNSEVAIDCFLTWGYGLETVVI